MCSKTAKTLFLFILMEIILTNECAIQYFENVRWEGSVARSKCGDSIRIKPQ